MSIDSRSSNHCYCWRRSLKVAPLTILKLFKNIQESFGIFRSHKARSEYIRYNRCHLFYMTVKSLDLGIWNRSEVQASFIISYWILNPIFYLISSNSRLVSSNRCMNFLSAAMSPFIELSNS